MIVELAGLIVDENKWLPASLAIAFLAVAVLLYRHRRSDRPARPRISAAMNLFFGVTIGTMAFGHLLAVSTRLAMGTLQGPVPLFYLIGIALAIPSWWLVYHTRRMLDDDVDHGRATLRLNVWLAITLLGLGAHNLPLAVPGFLNIGYHVHSRPAVGWAIVATAVLVNAGLLVGSLVFLASGQSFEQFRGIQ